MLQRFHRAWNRYKYRFVPWLALNLRDRQGRKVPKGFPDKIISDEAALKNLRFLFKAFENGSINTNIGHQTLNETNMRIMKDSLGFCVEKADSFIDGGGKGVHVTDGVIPEGTITSLYPGTLYMPHDPIFIQSIKNPFVFQCIDRMLIDGNDKGLSKMIFRSCSQRDRIGPYLMCDSTWLTGYPLNPLNIGQFVNNQNKANQANVAYQELEIDETFDFRYWKYLPNTWYSPNLNGGPRRLSMVLLVSLRKIEKGEELFSSYFTLVS